MMDPDRLIPWGFLVLAVAILALLILVIIESVGDERKSQPLPSITIDRVSNAWASIDTYVITEPKTRRRWLVVKDAGIVEIQAAVEEVERK